MLEEHGVDLQALTPLYESCEDCISFNGPQKVTTGLSAIDGIGLFARWPIAKGELIAVARTGRFRTPAGRYTNHSDLPNADAVVSEGEWRWMARCDIAEDEEILINYRQVLELHQQ